MLDSAFDTKEAAVKADTIESPAENETPAAKTERIKHNQDVIKKRGAAPKKERTSKEAAVSAADNASKAVDSGIDAINALFADATNPNKLRTIGFDDEMYAKIKPILKQMWDASVAAFGDTVEAVQKFVKEIAARVNREAKPYIMKFYKEEMVAKPEETQEQQPKDQTPDELQAPYYVKSSGATTGKLAPANLADLMKGALDELENRVGNIDDYVMEKLGYPDKEAMFKGLSGEQIDAVALAIHAIDNNSGIIIGDQTGVGKGRIASAVIKYANKLGLKPIFITEKPKLFSDINRDMVDIHLPHPDPVLRPFIVGDSAASHVVAGSDEKGKPNIVYPYHNEMRGEPKKAGNKGAILNQSVRYAQVINDPEGSLKDFDYVAITYSQLSGSHAAQRRAMVTQLAQGNIIVMDEAHNAAGESDVGAFFKDTLQPAARSGLYLSATYAKRPSAMALYSMTELGRTGMGPDELQQTIEAGGVPMQQIISSLLAEGGQYIRRENDYKEMEKPTIQVNTDEAHTKELERKMDASTDILRDIVDFSGAFNKWVKSYVADKINGNVRQKKDRAGVDSPNFASVVHNYIRQLMLALKVDDMINEGVQAIKDGDKPIFYIDNTMETFLTNFAKENNIMKGQDINIEYGEVIRRGLTRLLKYTVKPAGNRPKYDVEIAPEELPPHLKTLFDAVNAKVDAYNVGVTISPIDTVASGIVKRVKEELGIDIRVAEITGRTSKVNVEDDGNQIYATRSETNRNDMVDGFNDGKYKMLVFNQAGATGLSLHPTAKTADKSPRKMFIVQPSLNVDSYMQALGRIFRTGQIHKPKYVNMLLNLPAETRPAIIQNKKLASINANLAAKTEGVFSMDVPDMDNHYGDEVITGYLREHGDIASKLKMDVQDEAGEGEENNDVASGLFGKFSGRLALLPVAQQQEVWGDVIANYNALINYVTELGENTLVAQNYDLKAKTVSSDALQEQTGDGLFQSATNIEVVQANILKKQYPEAKVKQLIEEALDGKTPDMYGEAVASDIKAAFKTYLEEQATKMKTLALDGTETEAEAGDKLSKASSLQSVIDTAKRNEDYLHGLLQDFQVGSAYSINVHGIVGGSEDAVLIGAKYTHTKSGSPVAPSKLAFTFAVASSQQKITIPASKVTTFESARAQGEGVPSGWDSRIPKAVTEQRHIVTGNLLSGMGIVKNNGKIVYYTDSEGAVRPGILINNTQNARDWLNVAMTRMVVSLQTLKDLIVAGKMRSGEGSDRIRANLPSKPTIHYVPATDRWVIRVDASRAGEQVWGDRGLSDLSLYGRFDQGRGNDASIMSATFGPSSIGAVIDRMAEIRNGDISFSVPRSAMASAQPQATDGTNLNMLGLQDIYEALMKTKVAQDGIKLLTQMGHQISETVSDQYDKWKDGMKAALKDLWGKFSPFMKRVFDIVNSEKGQAQLMREEHAGALKRIATSARNATQNFLWDAPSRLGVSYMTARYRAKGAIERASEMARSVYNDLAKFRGDEVTTQQIYDFLTTKDADVSMIDNVEAQSVANSAKSLIMKYGQELVDAGLLTQETLDKRAGEYLPRLYMKHLLGEDKFSALGGGGKKMDLSETRMRDESIPEDVRNLILGEIKDPAYLVFMAIARPARDVALHDWMSQIASNTDWVLPQLLADWNIVEGAPKTIGQNLQYSQNDDGTYDVTVRSYQKNQKVYDGITAKEVSDLVGVNTGKYITLGSKDGWNKVGQVSFKNSTVPGKYDIRIDGRTAVDAVHSSVAPFELDDLVGQARADMIRRGEGRSKGGKQVTPYYLMKESRRITGMVDNGYLPQESLAVAARMRKLARETLEVAGVNMNEETGEIGKSQLPSGYKQIPTSSKYGPLSGAVVRSEVFNDIVGEGGSRGMVGDKNWAAKALGDDGFMWTIHKHWKAAKTSMNAPTHITNLGSNVMLLHLSGIPMHRMPAMIIKSVQSLLSKDKYWRIGKEYGFTAASFTNQELARVNTELLDMKRTMGEKAHPLEQMKYLAGKLINLSGDAYQMWEVIGKTAKLIDCMERQNMPAARAAIEAHVALYDYSDVSSSMKFLRMSPFGAAFLTYTVKTTEQLAKLGAKDVSNIIKTLKPGESYKELGSNRVLAGWASIAFSRKIAMYAGIFKMIPILVAGALDWDDDDYEKFMNVLPKFMREKNHVFIFPQKDENGNLRYIDVSRFMPWEPVLTAAKHLAKGDISTFVGKDVGLFGGPIPQMANVLFSKKPRDPNTDREIVSSRSKPTPAEKAAAYGLYFYNMFVPSMFAFGRDSTTDYAGQYGALDKTISAFTGHVNPNTGARIATPGEALGAWVGVNSKSYNIPVTRGKNLLQMKNEISGLKADAKMELSNRNYTNMEPAERSKVQNELRDKFQKKIKNTVGDIEEYRSKTNYRDTALYKK